jgi:hypothetical protein
MKSVQYWTTQAMVVMLASFTAHLDVDAFSPRMGTAWRRSIVHPHSVVLPVVASRQLTTKCFSSTVAADNSTSSSNNSSIQKPVEEKIPLCLSEGVLAVYKPLDWTSSDVVSYIRGMLERDARNRGAVLPKRRSKNSLKVGHGGTLDPLATGVLVIGVGRGTKALQG